MVVQSSRGYYEIAKTRFLDVICLMAESKLRSKCQDDLTNTLEIQLNADSLDRCHELMAEDPQREARRLELTKIRAKLVQAQQWLATVRNVDEDVDMHTASEATVGEQHSLIHDEDDFYA